MRGVIDELNFRTRVLLMIVVVAIVIAVVGWDMIEVPFRWHHGLMTFLRAI